jgi:hypothetical protein
MIGYQEIGCHMVFDVKMAYTHKAWFVAGGHTMEVPASYLFKCCFPWECLTCIPDCCSKWYRYHVLWFGECLPQCTMLWEDLVWRWLGVWQGQGQGVDSHKSTTRFEECWCILKIIAGRSTCQYWFPVIKGWPGHLDLQHGMWQWFWILWFVDDILALSYKAKDVVKEIS